ncbi:MAG TPA: diguanylate cyclase [Acidobacteriaceae bacterium]|nr:diguanylate cyclase [Acidobacteriaceae bacterium]
MLASTPLCAQSPQKPLTSIAAIRHLSPTEAAEALPVEVTGVVTYSNSAESDLFVQDDGGWIYVQPDKKYAITPGSRVVVKGRTGASYSTQIVATSVQIAGPAPLPRPAFLSYHEAVERANDCRYVTMQGIVRAASYQTTSGSSLYLLRIEVDDKMVDVVVRDYPQFSPDRLLDATVRVTGALGGTYDVTNDRILALRINVYSSSAIEVVHASNRGEAGQELIPLAILLKSNEVLKIRHRVFTSGILTLYDPGEKLVVQDGDSSLMVETRQTDPVSIGQRVEVTGFVTAVDGVAGLDSGQFLVLPGEAPLAPHAISYADAMTGLYNNKLISIEGEVISQTRQSNLDTIILRSGNSVFPVVYRKRVTDADPFPSYSRGTRIRATGVCMVHVRGFWGAVESIQVQVRSPEDIAVTARASWWTLAHLFLVTSAILGFALLALAWGLRMRWRLLDKEKLLRARSDQEASRLSTLARMEQQRSHILELINSYKPLPVVLAAIQAYTDEMWAGLKGYTHVLQNRRLELMTRTHLTPETIARLHDLDPSSSEEACAEAVRSHGLVGPNPSRNLWSRPILSSRGEVLGTMTFEGKDGDPLPLNMKAFEFGCNLAAIAIDNRRLYEDVLHRSEHDQLTGLANRTLVHRRLEEALEEAHANTRHAALLYLDLDDFKNVNDSYTHRVGDAYLIEVAQRFRACLRERDTLGRIGGDEFIAVLTDLEDAEIAHSVAERLVHAMDAPFAIEGHTIRGAVSVGLAFYPSSSSSAIGIMQFADHAMYAAKRAGGNRVSNSGPDLLPTGARPSLV